MSGYISENSTISMRFRNSVRRSSCFDLDKIKEGDYLCPIYDILRKRKEAAIMLLRNDLSLEDRKAVEGIFSYTNYEIILFMDIYTGVIT